MDGWTRDEFDLRVGRALASRTYADLAALTADVPARLTGTRLPEPARKTVNKKAVVAMAWTTAAFIGLWPVVNADAGRGALCDTTPRGLAHPGHGRADRLACVVARLA